MDKKERDDIDDLFRSQLYDWEADTEPEDWQIIAGRLPKEVPVVPFRSTFRYWAAAAAVLLAIVSGALYLLDGFYGGKSELQAIQEKTPVAVPDIDFVEEETIPKEVLAETAVAEKSPARFLHSPLRPAMLALAEPIDLLEENDEEYVISMPEAVSADSEDKNEKKATVYRETIISNRAVDVPTHEKEKSKTVVSSRKWGFGMGAGSITAGTDNTIAGTALRSEPLDDGDLESLNAASNSSLSTNLPKTDVRHKTPVSFGFSVSRYLNNRWSLQSGLTYSLLVSEWETNQTYRGEVKQHLHFIGIPLSVSYKIAEWNRFQFYAAAGAMAEVNVAGKEKTTLYAGTEKIGTASTSKRMKEWYWSVNARAGVSYPIIRYVSAFAEVGAGYYFDNGSEIETIHSDKPFNVNLNVGLRLGF